MKIIYLKNGVKYSTVLPKGSSHSQIQLALLAKGVGMSQVISINR